MEEKFKEAMNELEEMSKDEELRRVAELREKAIRDEKNGLRHAREDGLREGIEKTNKEVAKKMKEKHIPIETIEEITKLTKEEIENL